MIAAIGEVQAEPAQESGELLDPVAVAACERLSFVGRPEVGTKTVLGFGSDD